MPDLEHAVFRPGGHEQHLGALADAPVDEAPEDDDAAWNAAPTNARAIYAISFNDDNAVRILNCRMAEYTKAVVDGRPQFHISIVRDISPNCDCHGENDAPILPDVGMFASFDPVALDQACADACLAS